jgi:putative transcriptional regulator
MSITHHPGEATLMSYAAGSLPNALAGVIAAHAAVCARCRSEITNLEHLGAALLEGMQPVAIERAEPQAPIPGGNEAHPRASAPPADVPRPLAHIVGGGLDAVHWRWLGPGIWHSPLPLKGEGDLRLLKLAPGRHLPEHGHTGSELTLVLKGAFHDETGWYERWDVAELDEEIEHRPVADAAAGCICVVACEGPLRFHGLLPRLLRPLHGF